MNKQRFIEIGKEYGFSPSIATQGIWRVTEQEARSVFERLSSARSVRRDYPPPIYMCRCCGHDLIDGRCSFVSEHQAT